MLRPNSSFFKIPPTFNCDEAIEKLRRLYSLVANSKEEEVLANTVNKLNHHSQKNILNESFNNRLVRLATQDATQRIQKGEINFQPVQPSQESPRNN